MKITKNIVNALTSASAKALATNGPSGLNVVPVSTVQIIDQEIYLVDYFFHKTRTNLKNNTSVALTFWQGLSGYQLKADSQYLSKGAAFTQISQWAQKEYPERHVYGVVKVIPKEIFNISVPAKKC